MWTIRNNSLTNSEFLNIPDYYVVPPYPDDIWVLKGNQIKTFGMITLPSSYITPPYPDDTWVIKDSTLRTAGMLENYYGGCSPITSLIAVELPSTLKNIGEYAFRNTALSYVKIPKDCIYFDTTFPKDCEIIKV